MQCNLVNHLKTCSISCFRLHDRLEKEEGYLLKEPSIYSIDLLFQVRMGKLAGRLGTLVKDCLAHVSKCQVSFIQTKLTLL